MHLSGLFIYPVKSLRGVAVETAQLDALGLVGDRRFLVVDAENRFLTQRSTPRLALLETALTATSLILRNPAHGSAAVGLHDPGATLTVTIWRDTVRAVDCGVEIAVWLSDFLRQPCRLVRVGDAYLRPVDPARAGPGHQVGFADAFPLLLLGDGSWHDLNDRLLAQGEEPVPLDRFRANLVVRGLQPYAEDDWRDFHIGGVALRNAGPCARCVIITTDQTTAERGPEPLRTLAAYRRDPHEPGNVNFARNIIHLQKSGTLRVGDPVTLD